MRITKSINITYYIDDEILLEYIESNKEYDIIPEFYDFIDWLDSNYFMDDFIDEEDYDWDYINDSFNINQEFNKEINRLINNERV